MDLYNLRLGKKFYPTSPCQGLSVSMCFRDMAKGLVDPSLVINIIAGTCTKDDASMERVLSQYKDMYWRDCAEEAARLYREFWYSGKIDQPRLRGDDPPNISKGHWITD